MISINLGACSSRGYQRFPEAVLWFLIRWLLIRWLGRSGLSSPFNSLGKLKCRGNTVSRVLNQWGTFSLALVQFYVLL